ncbi:Nop56p-like nucleolar protein [Encephalitozoon intestinalis ATCC 50506]|uniref:Nucleolar protein 56 n=1 Tax=Encephalitozoon intestinalis (strain ATCC 50506) TaxID=876142 RepID=E0S933_ENCIT|nr:Nop56p-like nucleolar protein [Encephalitozoon intestinalis ATCC 50506]ADM12289.1 Nop56p-like nucleolar protein [Encephalitozoon intestinalis ATCC 50506]UTX46098.1 nucleolar protein 56 [Encephalitozoon intestinalis]
MEHLLFEYAGGYGLFELKEYEDMSKSTYEDYTKLTQVLNLRSGMRFASLNEASDHLKCLSQGEIHEDLKKFLELNNVKVLHCDSTLRKGLDVLGIKQKESENIMRGVRKDYRKLMRLDEYDSKQMVLGLAYEYSREKVEYNVKREDFIVIHTVMLLEQVGKDINSYSMRIREIYGWVFPELSVALKDNHEYIKAVKHFVDEETEGNKGEWKDIEVDVEKLEKIKELKRNSMGMKLSPVDMINLKKLIEIVNNKIEIRKGLSKYLKDKMESIAPNLAAILGDVLAARLISQGGGLLNLAKAPASTFQLLGAEKSLFKSLKTKTKTPKYGLIYTTSYLSRVRDKDKGRICRYIATKCSIAAKIDYFGKDRTPDYGLELKSLIDKKIQSLRTNEEVERTSTVIQRVFDRINGISKDKKTKDDLQPEDSKKNSKLKKQKKKSERQEHKEEVFRFGERRKGGDEGSKRNDKRVSFDLTRNDIKETEKMPKKFKRKI